MIDYIKQVLMRDRTALLRKQVRAFAAENLRLQEEAVSRNAIINALIKEANKDGHDYRQKVRRMKSLLLAAGELELEGGDG